MVESCDDEYLKFDLEYDQVNMILAIFVLYWLKLQDFIFSKHTHYILKNLVESLTSSCEELVLIRIYF